MKIFQKVFCFPLLFLTLSATSLIAAVDCFTEDSSQGVKAFKQHCLPNRDGVPQDILNIRGGIYQIGNQIICATNNDDLGKCVDPGDHQNNDYLKTSENAGTTDFLGNADYDNDDSTISSSMASLELKDGDEILWARLQWIGQMDEDNNENDLTSSARTIKFKTPTSGTYQNIECDFYGTDVYNYYGNKFTYKCSADVTNLVASSGEYWVADVDSELGVANSFASWALTMLYKNNTDDLVNVTLFEGYEIFWNQHAYFQISGFLTPLENSVNARLFLYAGEADYGYTDYLEISNADNTATTTDISKDFHGGSYTKILNPMNNSLDDFGNGSISTYGENVTNRTPNFENSLGTDIDSVYMVNSSDNQILTNKQTSTTLHFYAEELLTMSMLGTQINLYAPQFCYDYAYKQDGIFFTEENDGTKDPRIVGNNLNDTNITVGIYIKNRIASDISVTDMTANILNIDTNQATYERNTTKFAMVGDLTANSILDTDLIVSDSDVEGIEIGTIQTNEYFYIYYDLDPKVTSIDMPLEIAIDYNLTLDGVTTKYTLVPGSNIDMCSGANFEYNPVIGIFNAVHNNYYDLDLGGSNSYYNLPTQVTNREGNFKIISMNPENTDELIGRTTIVAVEMIDVAGFHDTDPSCKQMNSTISERVWLMFENNATSVPFDKNALEQAITNGMTKLSNSYDFYTKANANAAFRISYNSMDNNASVPYIEKNNNGEYSIANWRSEWNGEDCNQDMVTNGFGNDNKVASYCNLTSGNFSDSDLANCMECVYGLDTRFICSRDNFSIRPEAFMINIDDQNQSNITSQTRLTDNFSGVASPTLNVLNLAADYNYSIKVNATNFLDNTPSAGYQKPFNASNVDDIAQYTWESRSGVSANSCNDESNKTLTIGFTSGSVDANTSVNQVGEYRLHMLDKTWTTVDNNPDYMVHHTGSYFLGADIPDCVLDSSVVKLNDPYPTTDILNGCNISSNHTNDNANLVYNDINVTFHPYKFDLNSITQSFGIDNNTTLSANSFIYMADTSFNNNQDENLSFHLNGFIKAVGYDGTNLSNFTSQCYAKPINIDINNSDTTLSDVAGNAVAYQAKLHNLDINATLISADTIDVDETTHNTPMQIQVPTSNFTKLLNGSINTRLNLNFNRVNNVAANPIRVSYDSYNVECTDAINDCTFSADLVTKTTRASLDVDQNITHYYGRTHAPLYRYAGPSGDGLIYYEVFCNGAGCDKTLLQDGVNSRYNDDPRWFINTKHSASLGTANTVTQKGSRANITATNANGNNIATGKHPDSFTFTYDAVLGYPYKGTMQNNASRWLIYNPYNANDTTNEFNIEYDTSAAGWSGVNQTDSSTSNDGASRTNRRSMW